MARNAGFAFAASFSEELVNGVLRAYHANLVPAYSFTLPNILPVAGLETGVSGGLVLLPPSVTLRANANDQVTTNLGFAGEVTFAGGPVPGTYEVLLTLSIDLNLIAQFSASEERQTITAGLDLSAATVTGVAVSVYSGNPLSQVYTAALGSQTVLDALSMALRAIPPSLTQVTPSNFSLPATISEAYNPPDAPAPPNPRSLFTVPILIHKLAVRPVSSADGTSGALAIGIDLLQPFTQGDASGLIDLNTTVTPVGYLYTPNNEGTWNLGSIQDPLQAHNSQVALAVNGDVITNIVNTNVTNQVAQKFVATHVAFAPPDVTPGQPLTADCLKMQFEYYTAPLSAQGLYGVSVAAHVVYYTQIQRALDGYPVAIEDIDLGAVVTPHVSIGLNQVPLRTTAVPPPAAGAMVYNVTFTSNPPGSRFYLDGGTVQLGVGAYNTATFSLAAGAHTVSATPGTFMSWSTSDPLSFDNKDGDMMPPTLPTLMHATGTLEVGGDGSVQLTTSAWDPLITEDYWGGRISNIDVALPWWVTPGMALFGWLYAAVATFFRVVLGTEIWYPTILGNLLATTVVPMLQTGVNDALSDLPVLGQRISIKQLPATTAPDFSFTAADFALSEEGMEAYVNVRLTDDLITQVQGYEGSIPYLLLTDQDVSNPVSISLPQAPESLYPVRVDGVFNYPLGRTTVLVVPSFSWDVHDTKPIGFVLKVPPGLFNPGDPTVRVEWTVTSIATGQTLQQTSGALYPANGSLSASALSIDHASAALQHESGFAVAVALRQADVSGSVDTLFSLTLTINVADHFNRAHPFVRWGPLETSYYPGIPFWNATPAGAHQPGKRRIRTTAVSRIHRTDLWSGGRRCLVAETSGEGFHLQNKLRNSGYLPEKDRARGLSYQWQYLDELPLTMAQIEQNRDAARGVLCDYCFFGGPTKTILRTDFPTPLT